MAWILVSLPTLVQADRSEVRFALWLGACLVFGLAFGLATASAAGSAQRRLVLLLVQACAVIAMVGLLCNGYEGTLLALVAMQLAPALPGPAGLGWIAAQSLAMGVAISLHWSVRPALVLAPPYLGLQILAYLVFRALHREAAARDELSRANAELRALHGVLEDGARAAERLSISRELHDALGSHLTALSLTLEAAAHETRGDAREHVLAGQSLARLLLTDVHDSVDALRSGARIDVGRAVRELASGFPAPAVHLEGVDDLILADPDTAHTLLRCAREILTNAARHSGAAGLWLEFARRDGQVELRARDDGAGTAEIRPGFGLTGLRERVEAAGGELLLESRPGAGFSVVARLPASEAAP